MLNQTLCFDFFTCKNYLQRKRFGDADNRHVLSLRCANLLTALRQRCAVTEEFSLPIFFNFNW